MTAITSESFGHARTGQAVNKYVLQNANGMRVAILDYGCTIQSVLVPNAAGKLVDVVLGYDDIEGYEAGSCFFGAFVGRYANRIKDARFTLGDKHYELSRNDGNNHLHGSYSFEIFEGSVEGERLVFRRTSPDGEEGYPGTLRVQVSYELRDDNALVITYEADTDAQTVLNFTNHSYFNLNGDGADVLDHVLTIAADRVSERDEEALPTGTFLSVAGTPLDFRQAKRIGADIFSQDEQVSQCRGYDHNYLLNCWHGGDDIAGGERLVLEGVDKNGEPVSRELPPFARAVSDKSGIVLEAYTTQPAVQLYSANYLDEDAAPCGKGGVRYPRYGGFCLETQHYPSSPTFPEFPSTVLRPGELYRQTTIYRFGCEGA